MVWQAQAARCQWQDGSEFTCKLCELKVPDKLPGMIRLTDAVCELRHLRLVLIVRLWRLCVHCCDNNVSLALPLSHRAQRLRCRQDRLSQHIPGAVGCCAAGRAGDRARCAVQGEHRHVRKSWFSRLLAAVYLMY